jgi:hypothetical protein
MKKIALLLFSGAALLTACTEEEQNPIGAEQNAAVSDDAFAESTFAEIDDLAYSGVASEGGKITSDDRFTCASIILKNDTITIDFGEGCTDPRGRIRAGKIIVSRTAPYFQKGATITATLDGFSIDGNVIHGKRVVKNLGPNAHGHYEFQVALIGGHITFNDGSELSRSSDFTRTWVRGANVSLDELHISGGASGTNREGVDYHMDIHHPLIYKVSCRYKGFPIAVQGVKTLIADGKELNVGYGDGTCDNKITVSMSGFSKTIELDMTK